MSNMFSYLVFVFFIKLSVQMGQTELSKFGNANILNLGLHNNVENSNKLMDFRNSLYIRGNQCIFYSIRKNNLCRICIKKVANNCLVLLRYIFF